MIIERMRGKFPPQYRFWDADWYATVTKEHMIYRYRLLLCSFIIGAIVPLILMVHDLYIGRFYLLINYIIPFIILVAHIVFLVMTKNIRYIVPSVLFISVIGFVMAMLFPGSQEAYLVILFVYPILVFKLTGTRKGRLWILLFLFVVFTLAVLVAANVITNLQVHLSHMQLAMCVLSLVLIYIITYTGEKQYEKYLDRLVNELVFDNVTGLPNKEVLVNSFYRDQEYVFAIVRIDNFSELVALFGYEFSDIILSFASQQIQHLEHEFRFRTFQLMYHEFGILLDMKDEKSTDIEIEGKMYQILNKLQEISMPWEKKEIRLVYRIGATVNRSGNNEYVLSQADIALKHGIKSYKPVTIYQHYLQNKQNAIDALIRFSVLVENREENSFKAVYQPVVDTTTNKVLWYESLIRIRNRDGQYVSIQPYLSIAKSTGFYEDITLFMLKSACDALKLVDLDVSINISILDIIRPQFLPMVIDYYEKIKDRPGTLIFEILESEDIGELETFENFMNTVRGLGCKIAIDDFGSGYSNLSNLLRLPVDIVKIDGSLIRRLLDDENAVTLVSGIVTFCKRSHKHIVAEFVENSTLLESVRKLEIESAQGRLWGEPKPIEELIAE